MDWEKEAVADYEELMSDLGWRTDTDGARAGLRFWLQKTNEIINQEVTKVLEELEFEMSYQHKRHDFGEYTIAQVKLHMHQKIDEIKERYEK
jgi:hypothetical protein